MKRTFVFNGTVLMGYDKFYNIDLNPINYPVTFLCTPVDLNNYRIKFKVLVANKDINHVGDDPCFIDETTSRGIVYCFEPPNLIEECTVEEVPLKDFSLWIGSPYKFYEFEDLLKGYNLESHHQKDHKESPLQISLQGKDQTRKNIYEATLPSQSRHHSERYMGIQSPRLNIS